MNVLLMIPNVKISNDNTTQEALKHYPGFRPLLPLVLKHFTDNIFYQVTTYTRPGWRDNVDKNLMHCLVSWLECRPSDLSFMLVVFLPGH